jgi:hypothetical protein
MLAAIVGLLLAGASAVDWQWRAAAQRAFLADEPYTHIEVKPGNLTVKEGESAVIEVAVSGRTGTEIFFFTREPNGENTEWKSESISLDDGEATGEREVTLQIPLDRIRQPLEYRIAAGSSTTGVYKIEVLYPLKIVRIESRLTAPEYTGLAEAVAEGGNFTGLAGSKGKLLIELDRAPQTAWLEMQEVATARRRDLPSVEPVKVPLVIDGTSLTTDFELTTDQTYTIFAQSADGMELPESKYRIRVRQDEAPQVWFETPAEALEVHTLAEILMRIRVSDDFGLSRAGIQFEVNNEEEYPLLAHDFSAIAEALEDIEAQEKAGAAPARLKPQTRATLEKVLPLEFFALTQQDSVMYYAFAEDNRPNNPQRTESDLRFIDIRPFRRLYRAPDEADGMNMPQQGPQLKSLEELIARQRYGLNRSIQLDRRFKHSGASDLSGVDALIKFEGELAKSTRELAEGLEARGIDETELLYQAEASMLSATDSLSAGKYDTATLQQRDALKYLIEGRNRLEILIRKNPNRAQLAALRQFDRMQQQKLRRPKSDEEEAREVAQRLKELADREDFVYATIPNLMASGQAQQSASSGGSGSSTAPMPMQPGESGTDPKTPMPKEGDMPPPADQPAGDQPAGDKPAGDTPEGDAQPMPAEGDAPAEGGTPMPAAPLTRQELQDRQLDIGLEAREIEKLLGRLEGVTDLAKERMAATAEVAEQAAEALGQGTLEEARGAVGAAREQFRELAEQVDALLAKEQADRIAAAQRMAAELAQRQQDFVDRVAKADPNRPNSGGQAQPGDKSKEPRPGVGEGDQKPDEPMPGLGAAADKIAAQAQTLADVLGAAAAADEPGDEESAEKVEQIAGGLGLKELAQRLQDLPGQVGEKQMEDAKNNAGDGAERTEAAAEALSALHRSIVAPRVDELAKVEQQLSALNDELDQLETPTEITNWHMEADDLVDELDKAGLSKEEIQAFVEEMNKGGWQPNARRNGWNWAIEGGRYVSPRGYRVATTRLLASLRTRMQELLLGDLTASGDEPIPPQYQDLVDRYYQVLASEGQKNQPAKAVRPVAPE